VSVGRRSHALCTYCGRAHSRESCWYKGLPGVRSAGNDTSLVLLSKETLEKYKDTITKNKEQAQGREAKSNFHKTRDFANAQGNHTFKTKSPGSSHMVMSVLDLHQGVDSPTEEDNASIRAYTLEVQLYNRTVSALLDTGATVNVISKSFFQQLQSDNLVHSYPCRQKIALAGAPATEARQACHLNFHVFVEYGIETSDLFYILDPSPYPLVFGLQLFTFLRLDKLLWRIENGRVNPLPSTQDPAISCDVPAPIESIQEPELKEALENLLQNANYDSILRYKDLSTPAKFPYFTITLKTEARPRFGRRVPIQAKHVPAVEKWIDKSLQEGLIAPLGDQTPSYLGYLVCAPKAGAPDELRICTALMELNEDTLLETVYLPPLLDAARCLAGHKYLGKLDCKSLFNQFEIREKDQLLTAFRTPKGAYYCKRLPFGLINGTFHAQKCLFDMLDKAGLNPNLPSKNPVVIYVDDIGFASDTPEDFIATLKRILDACAENNLKISPTKMHFSCVRMHFVGFSISTQGLEIADNRKMAFRQMKPPRDRSELKSFLGLINWFSPFLKELALVAAPLHDLTKKNTPFTWSELHQGAWDSIIQTCVAAPILHPVDPNYPLCIYADASNKGCAALLVQLEPSPRCVEMVSKKFTEAERRWNTTSQECAALLFALTKFQLYVQAHPTPVKIYTDHRNLLFMANSVNKKVQRWFEIMLTLGNFTIVHVPGTEQLADAPSRLLLLNASTPDSTQPLQSQQPAEPDNPLSPETCAVIETVHNNLAGHRGIHGTLRQLRIQKLDSHFKHPTHMCEAVRKFVNSCLICQLIRGLDDDTPHRTSSLCAGPFVEQSCDILSLKPDQEGFSAVTVHIDNFSGYCRILPARSKTAEAAADNVIIVGSQFGFPTSFRSDNQPFGSETFQLVLRKLNTIFSGIMPHTPTSNAFAERLCREVLRHVKGILLSPQLRGFSIPVCAALTERIINTTFRSRIRTTPVQLLLGTAVDLNRVVIPSQEQPSEMDTSAIPNMYIANLEETQASLLTASWNYHNRFMDKVLEEQSTSITKKSVEKGDFVLAKPPPGEQRQKMLPKWLGPFRVLDRPDPQANTTNVLDLTNNQVRQFHIQHLKQLDISRFPETDILPQLLGLAALNRDAPEFIIETVLDHRPTHESDRINYDKHQARGRKPKNSFSFLIKWKNFPEPEWTDYNYTLPATAPFQQYCMQYPNLRMTS